MMMRNYFLLIILFVAVAGCKTMLPSSSTLHRGDPFERVDTRESEQTPKLAESQAQSGESESPTFQGSKYLFGSDNSKFRFTGQLPEWLVSTYVPEIQSINIFDTRSPGEDFIEKSQIFIRFFEADQFLTLSTVDILDRKEASLNGHATVKYDIEKKPSVANFPYQPAWRNERHTVLDIRLASTGRTMFYVLAKNPSLPQRVFDSFIDSLVFDNDERGFVNPLGGAIKERITKKPFGLKVSPTNSPVSPERFSGFHTGVDLETTPEESDAPIEVRAFCGGVVKSKRNADGYGGVVVQECLVGDQPVTVVYGHVSLASVAVSENMYLGAGDTIGLLGNGFSAETDGERKHLHFGIHKGTAVNIRGYVSSESELGSWVDSAAYLVE